MRQIENRRGNGSVRSRVLRAAVATGIVAGIAGLFAPAPSAKDAPQIKDWVRGPVRYILDRSEAAQFKKLKEDRARALFIVRFWSRWDPTPGTLANETRREYWQRVKEANRRFNDSGRPGWMTDRGKIFILLGEPDESIVEEDTGFQDVVRTGPTTSQPSSAPDGRTAGGAGGQAAATSAGLEDLTSDRGLLRWTYRNLRSRRTDPETIIAFVRDSTGEWRISRNAEDYTAVFPTLSADREVSPLALQADTLSQIVASATGQDVSPGAPGGAANATLDALRDVQTVQALSLTGLDAQIALDLGEAQAIPSPVEEAAEIVTSNEFLDRLPITPRFAFFKAEDGNTQVRIGTSFPAGSVYRDETPPAGSSSFVLLYARFTPRPDGEPLFASNEDAPTRFRGEDLAREDARLEAWLARTLPPGEYEVALGVQDAATGVASSLRRKITVPDLSGGGLAISSLLPASGIAQTDGRLVPEAKVSAVFRRNEDLSVYFQVYNLAPPAETAGADTEAGDAEAGPAGQFDVTYRFYREDGGTENPVGRPLVYSGLDQAEQAWSAPLERWPSGKYRIEVTVKDSDAQRSAATSLDFEVL